MKPFSSRSSTVARTLEPSVPVSMPALFGEQLSTLYQLVQRSKHVFGSPIGPFVVGDQSFHLPRFVYFGPNTSDAALRLSFLAGFDQSDDGSSSRLSPLAVTMQSNAGSV